MKKSVQRLPEVNHRKSQSVLIPDLALHSDDYSRNPEAEFSTTRALPIIPRKLMGSYERFKLFSKNARQTGMTESRRASSVDLEIQSIPLR